MTPIRSLPGRFAALVMTGTVALKERAVRGDASRAPLVVALVAPALFSVPLDAQSPAELVDATGGDLYQAACANCHGADGRGLDRALVAFEEELPDFTDCDFAAREPDADWVAVAHQGGPVRGFSEMMPAFGDALSVAQLERVMSHIRTLCTDERWPRGELNLPRALVTEKAYPEDEWVVEADAGTRGGDDLGAAFVYEQRFGPRSQWEVIIPYSRRRDTESGSPSSGLGDIVLGVKHAVFHDIASGSILSFGAEAVLPTGDEARGHGAPGAATELFSSFGQLLPADAFLQAQAGVEVPFHSGGESEAFVRLVLGRALSSGPWGRGWAPMIEFLGKRGFESQAPVQLDVLPQLQVALNTRQHVLANIGVLVPVSDGAEASPTGDPGAPARRGRNVRLVAYVLLDWFDGGFFEGW